MESLFDRSDDLGPFKVLHINRPSVGLKSIVVVDNIACGAAIGGTRMAYDVSLEECMRLARAMTLKNAAAGLAHGGAKSVIFSHHNIPQLDKEQIIRAFADALASLPEYIAGPDMGTDETCMAWIHDEIGRSVGLPAEIGGIPLDEIGATGFGVSIAAGVAQDLWNIKLDGARVAIQGFGAVGKHTAMHLEKKGCILVSVADSKGAIYNENGLDLNRLIQIKMEGESVTSYLDAETLNRDAIVSVDCDIWIPAARPDAIHKDNVDQLKAKLVIQGANIPVTEEAEKILHERGIFSIPDFIANAGGVICAAVEYRSGTEKSAFDEIAEKIDRNTRIVIEESQKTGLMPRIAGQQLAERRVHRAMELTRWH